MRIYEDLRVLQGRLAVLQTVVLGLMLLLVVQFWQLQVLRGRSYRALAENNRIRSVTLAAPRGPLLDREGRILVENRPAFNVMFTPEHADDPKRALRRLAEQLSVPEATIRERVARRSLPSQPVVVKTDAAVEDVTVVEARRMEQPEASVEVVPVRSYPLGTAAAHVLGRVGEVTDRQLQTVFAGLTPGVLVGQAGIEHQYNQQLMGRDGARRIIVNSRGVEVAEAGREDPATGPAVTLTLDRELQRAMEQAMAGRAGSAVALDPRTGEILAMTSSPAYDPNEFSTGIEAAEWARLTTDTATPLMNRVIQGQYAPGSTFKVLLAAAALEEGVITPHTTFHCPGHLGIYGTVFRCHKEGGHGTLDLRRALALSCNVYFYNVGVRLEIERIARWARRFGLAAPTGVDLPHEVSGLVPDPAWKQRVLKAPWFAGETVSVSIGQGQVTLTPLQLARVAAAIANGGRLVRPHLLKAVDGKVVPYPDPTPIGLKPTTVEVLREAMAAVVAEGTGRRAAVRGVAVAGKTGSAQVVTHARLERDKHVLALQPHGWFMSFAPVDDPRIALAVLVEHGRSGGESAAPVTGEILSRYFGVPSPLPRLEPTPEEPVGDVPAAAEGR